MGVKEKFVESDDMGVISASLDVLDNFFNYFLNFRDNLFVK